MPFCLLLQGHTFLKTTIVVARVNYETKSEKNGNLVSDKVNYLNILLQFRQK